MQENIAGVRTGIEMSERFEIAFNQIHSRLKNIVSHSRTDAFMDLLYQASTKHSLVNKFHGDLKQFARLRNALVHEKTRRNFYIAEPHPEVVEKIEEISTYLDKPPSVMTIASSPVVTYKMRDRLEYVTKDTDQYEFSQFPVYRSGEFQFLLTKGGIMSWMAQNINLSNIALEGVKIGEVEPYQSVHNVGFLSKNESIFDLEDLFEEYYQKGHKLEAVIITETGSRKEKPIGIITSWDLIKIDLIGEKKPVRD